MRYLMCVLTVIIVLGGAYYFRKWINDMGDGDPPSGTT